MPQEKEASVDQRSDPIVFRPGREDDLVAAHNLFFETICDLSWRMGIQDGERIPPEEERAEDFRRWRPILDHLAATADQYWVAERAGAMLGLSRSILRDGVRELTEFFVSPQAQSSNIGRELLSRAMPPGAHRTYILASIDLRAQALYHKFGVFQVCAVYTFYQELKNLAPPQMPLPAEITFMPISAETLPLLAKLDQAILGHRRDADHLWLMSQRTGFLLMRADQAVGYGYIGETFSGPFVLIDQKDYPVALAHAEGIAFANNFESVGIDTPMLNCTAIEYLLGRGYQMSPFFCFYMCSEQPAHVGNTIITGPMIMI